MFRLRLCVIGILIVLIPMALAQEETPEATLEVNVDTEIDALVNLVDASFSADNLSPLLGEPVELILKADAPTNVEIVGWAEFPEEDTPFQVIEAGDIEQETLGDTTSYTQTLELVVWEVGFFNTPELFITYINPNTGATLNAPIQSVFFNTQSVLDPEDTILRPNTDLIELPYFPPWVVVIVIVVIATVLWLLNSFRRSQRFASRLAQAGTPFQKTVFELRHLIEQNLPAETVYPLVAEHLRMYLATRFGLTTSDLTTIELMGQVREHPSFTPRLANDLQRVLEQADLVKFAQFSPDSNSTIRIVNYAIQWLESSEKVNPTPDV